MNNAFHLVIVLLAALFVMVFVGVGLLIRVRILETPTFAKVK